MINSSFPKLLKSWRNYRGLTQVQLAEQAKLSHRHINFLENGRSKPSMESITALLSVLDLSPTDANILAKSAGYNIESESLFNTAIDKQVIVDLKQLLLRQNPYPAAVIDNFGEIITSNKSFIKMGTVFLENEALTSFHNIFDIMISEKGLRPYIENWQDFLFFIYSLILQESHNIPPESRFNEVVQKIEACSEYDESWKAKCLETPLPVFMDLKLHSDKFKLNYLTTHTSLGPAYDVSLRPLRLILYHPQDEQTHNFLISKHQ